MIIDNKVKTIFIESVAKNHYIHRTLEIKDPKLFAYCLESDITNELGYTSIRESMEEEHEDTHEGLLRHLANMEYIVLEREFYFQKSLSREHMRALLGMEELYKLIKR